MSVIIGSIGAVFFAMLHLAPRTYVVTHDYVAALMWPRRISRAPLRGSAARSWWSMVCLTAQPHEDGNGGRSLDGPIKPDLQRTTMAGIRAGARRRSNHPDD
jgi:hypothetical protein